MVKNKILDKLHDIRVFKIAIGFISRIAVIYLEPFLLKSIKGKEFFFFVGMGRSGTAFIAYLLNKNSEITAYHEAIGDKQALTDAYNDINKAANYICGYRKLLIATRLYLSPTSKYCEANSYLRYHTDALTTYLPNTTIIHVVRDGRLVVRSMMNRGVFKSESKGHSNVISPKIGEKYYKKWKNMDRFQKTCWYWSYTNEFLLKKNLSIVRFEDLINSYNMFLRKMPHKLTTGISYNKWKKETSKPKNISKNYEFPNYYDWTEQHKRQFEEICGPTMKRLGYF